MGQTAGIFPTCGSVSQLSPSAREIFDRPWEIELGNPGHTEQLTRWITDVRQKKLKCHRSPRRNFRMEAVLTHALYKAEYELRAKQLSRIARWQRVKKHLLVGVDYGSCGLYNAERELKRCDQRPDSNIDLWRENLCEDLSSMVDFLQQLKQVKSLVQR